MNPTTPPTTGPAGDRPPFSRADALLGCRDTHTPFDLADLAVPAPPIRWVQAAPGRWEGWAAIWAPLHVIEGYQFVIEYRPDLHDLPRLDDPDAGCDQQGPWWTRWWYPPCDGISLASVPTGACFAHTLHNAQTICRAYLTTETTRTATDPAGTTRP